MMRLGLESAANRPKGLSIGPNRSTPPRSVAFATAASQSGTAKYTFRYAGTSGGKSSPIAIRPSTVSPWTSYIPKSIDSSSNFRTVYGKTAGKNVSAAFGSRVKTSPQQ
ncbi:hypothetical protein SMICM304S_04400 [Streptomyces microflavus]